MNERWLASVTYADNGAYNRICPKDHGLSYLVIGDARVLLRDAIAACGELLLGKGRGVGRAAEVLRQLAPHPPPPAPVPGALRPGLVGKPESYYFPEELNVDRNAFPATPMGVDPAYTDRQVLSHLRHYFKGDNRLTDLANTINLVRRARGGTCRRARCTPRLAGDLRAAGGLRRQLHPREPGERRGDAAGPARPGPAREGGRDGFEKVCDYILSMIRCRMPATATTSAGSTSARPWRCATTRTPRRRTSSTARAARASRGIPISTARRRRSWPGGREARFAERAAFGVIVLAGTAR